MPIDQFANNASTTVTSGGTSAAAAGTSESWTVASSASFPTASSTASPPTQFRVVDPAAPTEWMTVTNVSGTTWTVTRGTEGAPTTHTSGFTVQLVATAGWLQARDDRALGTNIKQVFGAKADGKTVTDAAMTSGAATLTSATAGFTSADVGKAITVSNATSTSFRLATKITAVNSGTSVTLAHPARASQTAQTIVVDGVRTVADAVTTNDSTTLTSATAAFTSADVGKKITVTGAGRMALVTTISSVTNTTTVVLAASATRTCSAVQAVYGTDDTVVINKAFVWAGTQTNTPARLYFPRGMYLVRGSNLGTPNPMQLLSNTVVTGDGWGTIIRSIGGAANPNLSMEIWGTNFGSGGSSDPSTNVSGIVIQDLQMQGTVVEEGFLENADNLLSLNACTNVLVRNVKFYGIRSDGIYLGSGTTGGIERHNQRIRIENCTFDGINGDQRQGISIIDGDDVSITGCTFANLTNSAMPGAIDIEPNPSATWAITRGIRIANCYFTQIGGNIGVVSWQQQATQAALTTPAQDLHVVDNVFYNNLTSTVGITVWQPQTPTDSTPRTNAVIARNILQGTTNGIGLLYPFDIDGVRGVEVIDNVVDTSRNSFLIGGSWLTMDLTARGNVFKDVGYNGGVGVELALGTRIVFDQNEFEHISPTGGGIVFRFINSFSGNGASTDVRFVRNLIRQGSSNSISTVSGLVAGHAITANTTKFYDNQLPSGLAITPFVNQTISYTITTSALTVDASLVPPNGTVVLTGSTTTAAGALTISNPTVGQIITFQYVIPTTNFTYATASNMKFGTAVAHTLTAARSDSYTMRFDGTNWTELSRAVNVGAF